MCPEIKTGIPPDVSAELGRICHTDTPSSKRKGRPTEVNSSWVNPTSRLTVLGPFFVGVTQRADVAETNVPGVALKLPNLQRSVFASMKLPATVTVLPPATGPALGFKKDTAKSGRT